MGRGHEIKTTNKPMKRRSTSLVIREIQRKAKMRHYLLYYLIDKVKITDMN